MNATSSLRIHEPAATQQELASRPTKLATEDLKAWFGSSQALRGISLAMPERKSS